MNVAVIWLKMRYRIPHLLFAIALVAVILAGVSSWRKYQRTSHGLRLTHRGDSVRVSWGTPSGFSISPKSTLSHLNLRMSINRSMGFPALSHLDGVWMWQLEPKHLGKSGAASFVNPRNGSSLDQMTRMIRLSNDGNTHADEVTRIAAGNYVYLGYAVRNSDDVGLLVSTLKNRKNISLDSDIQTPNGTLFRLCSGVEKSLASDPTDQNELDSLRRTIPVMFELTDRRNGHPCDSMHVLYLDGHVELIDIGEKFPATQEVVDAFSPPKT